MLGTIETRLRNILELLKELMATAADFQTVLADINTQIDRIQAKLGTTGSMTADEENATLAAVQAVDDRLKTL